MVTRKAKTKLVHPRFHYSSRLFITFAAIAGNVSHFSLCDIGAGDGRASLAAYRKLNLTGTLRGYDVSLSFPFGGKSVQALPHVRSFDGVHIPEQDRSFDVVAFISVLHHAAKKTQTLLREAARVTREWVVVSEDVHFEPDDPEQVQAEIRHDRDGIFRTDDAWRSVFADAGFTVVASGPMFDIISPQTYYILRLRDLRRRCRQMPPCAIDVNNPMLALFDKDQLYLAGVFGAPSQTAASILKQDLA